MIYQVLDSVAVNVGLERGEFFTGAAMISRLALELRRDSKRGTVMAETLPSVTLALTAIDGSGL